MRDNSVSSLVTFLLNHARTLRAPQSALIFASGGDKKQESEGSWNGMVDTRKEYSFGNTDVSQKLRELCSQGHRRSLGDPAAKALGAVLKTEKMSVES